MPNFDMQITLIDVFTYRLFDKFKYRCSKFSIWNSKRDFQQIVSEIRVVLYVNEILYIVRHEYFDI